MALRIDAMPIKAVDFGHDLGTDRSTITVLKSDDLLNELKTSHHLVVELAIPNNGNKEFSFETAGFDTEKLDRAFEKRFDLYR